MEILYAEGFEHYNSLDDIRAVYPNAPICTVSSDYPPFPGHKYLYDVSYTTGNDTFRVPLTIKANSVYHLTFKAMSATGNLAVFGDSSNNFTYLRAVTLVDDLFYVIGTRWDLVREVAGSRDVPIVYSDYEGGWTNVELIAQADNLGNITNITLCINGKKVGSTVASSGWKWDWFSLLGESINSRTPMGIEDVVICRDQSLEPIGPLGVSAVALTDDAYNSGFVNQNGEPVNLYKSLTSTDINQRNDYIEPTGIGSVGFSTTVSLPLEALPVSLGVSSVGEPDSGLGASITVNTTPVFDVGNSQSTIWLPDGTYWSSDNIDNITLGAESYVEPIGEHVIETPSAGTYEFVVPVGVRNVSIVAVNSGDACVRNTSGYLTRTGKGGRLSYSNNIPVTPGDVITVNITSVNNGTITINGNVYRINNGLGFQVTNDGGAAISLSVSGSSSSDGGGSGGAGGYSGSGGTGIRAPYSGTVQPASPGSGGGGGGGGCSLGSFGSFTGTVGPGGGVGLYGETDNGTAGLRSNVAAERRGGNGSTPPEGTPEELVKFYGGGLNIAYEPNTTITTGLNGAVRIIWGGGRSFPHNAGWMEPTE